MPGATSTTAASKRKRDAKTVKPRKRARSRSDSEGESENEGGDADKASVQDRIMLLENQILESKKHFNNIVELIEIARGGKEGSNQVTRGGNDDDDDDTALTAAVTLCRVFMRLLAAGNLGFHNGLSEKDVVVVRWLRERLAEYEQILLDCFARSGDAAATVLTLAMRLLQAEGQHLRRRIDGDADDADRANKKGGKKKDAVESTYFFPQSLLNAVVRSLVLSAQTLGTDVSEGLMTEFFEKFVSKYSDVRFYTFKAVAAALGGVAEERDGAAVAAAAATVDAAFFLLSLIDNVPTTTTITAATTSDEGEADAFYVHPPPAKRTHALYSVAQHKKQAQEAWVALLRRATQKEQRKRALRVASTVIAPWFTHPELLLDFLTDCYDAGGSTSLLALSGLYYLIRERNVDYPAFYAKLYSLLDGTVLHSKHRSRFFRLLDTFLASTHLPAQLVASFLKRLARLCLHAPPAAIVTVVPWIYNTLKAHPLCTFMIHRVPRTAAERDALAREGLADPFRPDEADPMQTQAIDSCLWEIVQLQSHYHPNVATIAKIISEQFTKQAYNVEDFLDHSYQSMFDAEINKEVKKTPVVEFQIPKHIFLPHDPASDTEDKLLAKLWDFA
ncbi:ribosome biogenesis protein [Niveomyces insectorum RCEF 264]|uniref:Ribosome biogenesis protein n=1 Tax=Niveomyces insectorum RCEF 264 TaxID=1081102 RepID=A0A162MMY4_9HYPO|nr:ribosome biogenesis protein [Niveomyces insectorum RCEF 264]